jgi:hypothetical protein
MYKSLILLLIIAFAFIIVITYIFVYKPRKPAETEEGFSNIVEELLEHIPDLQGITKKYGGLDNDDARELMAMCGKLSCMKADLENGSCRYSMDQLYSTSHDLQPISDVLNSCFTKTMPERDLDLIFEKYTKRSSELLGRITAAIKGSMSDCGADEKIMGRVITEIYNSAKAMNSRPKGAIPDSGASKRSDYAKYVSDYDAGVMA